VTSNLDDHDILQRHVLVAVAVLDRGRGGGSAPHFFPARQFYEFCEPPPPPPLGARGPGPQSVLAGTVTGWLGHLTRKIVNEITYNVSTRVGR